MAGSRCQRQGQASQAGSGAPRRLSDQKPISRIWGQGPCVHLRPHCQLLSLLQLRAKEVAWNPLHRPPQATREPGLKRGRGAPRQSEGGPSPLATSLSTQSAGREETGVDTLSEGAIARGMPTQLLPAASSVSREVYDVSRVAGIPQPGPPSLGCTREGCLADRRALRESTGASVLVEWRVF